jgi:hypothetical protein
MDLMRSDDLATHATPHPAMRFAEVSAAASASHHTTWREMTTQVMAGMPRYGASGGLIRNGTALLVGRGAPDAVSKSVHRHRCVVAW